MLIKVPGWLTTVSLSLLLSALCLPAFSQETTVQRKIFMTSDGTVEETTTTRKVVPGQVIVPAVVEAPVVTSKKVVIDSTIYKQSLADRQSKLRAVIESSVASGALSAADAARFRSELDRLQSLANSMETTKITSETILPLALEYDMIRANLKVADVEPIVQGTNIVLSESYVVPFDDLLRRRAGLEAKINNQLALGKLHPADAQRLRGMLDHVAVIENGYRSDGDISDKEARSLYNEFDRVGSAIDKAL